MDKKLKDLLHGLDVIACHGGLDRTVTNLAMDSRRVIPGSLFFALPGSRTDGSYYVEEAIDRGAVAVLTEKPRRQHAKVVFVQLNDVRLAMAEVSRRFFEFPEKQLNLFGITGTNGKTTVSHLIKFLLGGDEAPPVGMIGTIQYDLGRRTVPSYRTTPESIEFAGMLAQMKEAGCRDISVEVSSHGIEQKRVEGFSFKVATFLNLSRDHLDYHGTMEKYFEVKTRFFTGGCGAVPEAAVVNLEDSYGRALIQKIPEEVRVVTFGCSEYADIRATEVDLRPDGTTMRIQWPEGTAKVRSPLVGSYNVSNVLAAVASCYANGRDLNHILHRIVAFPGVPGRMERIDEGQGFSVFVDYAHTDDALRNALWMLKKVTDKRLLVVFGCGGDRDRSKRISMVQAVQGFADFSWATADNPRSEPLEQIFSDMRKGIMHADKIAFIEDRRRAISLALDEATEGDCLLIAGKGHESFQEFADTTFPFDDRMVCRELLSIKQIRTH